MEAIGNIVALLNTGKPISVDKIIEDVTKEFLNRNFNIVEHGLKEEALQNLTLISALVKHNQSSGDANDYEASSKKYNGLEKVWNLIFEACTTVPSPPQQCVYEFLVTCVSFCAEEQKKNYCSRFQGMMHMLGSLLQDQDKGEQNCQSILNLVEMLLQSDDRSLVILQKDLTQRLIEMLLCGGEALLDGPYIQRISGLVSLAIKSMNDEQFCKETWMKLYHTFTKRGQYFIQQKCSTSQDARAPQNTSEMPYCLVLLDILFDIAFYDSGYSTSSNEEMSFTHAKMILSHPTPWVVIQFGLCHRKSHTRKQALYALKKSISIVQSHEISVKSFLIESRSEQDCTPPATPIFQWDVSDEKEILSHWSDFILISETLEENQLHVISPVLRRLPKLVAASTPAGGISMHTSWVCVILQRMFSHESKAIIREGVLLSLQLDGTFPFLQQETGEFFLCSAGGEGLIPSFQDVNLFCDHRDNTAPLPEIPELPVIGKLLQEFFKRCFLGYDHPKELLCFMLKSLTQINWGPVPLYYICTALAALPETDAWEASHLHTLWSLMTRCLSTLDGRLRSAIQGTLMQALLRFTDCSKVTIDEVLNVILLCDMKTIFQSQTDLNEKMSLWLMSNLENFVGNIPVELKENIAEFVLYKVEQYLVIPTAQKVEKSTKELLDESKHSAAMILLLIQGLQASRGNNCATETLVKILSRLSDITDKASTHLYMPKEKTYKVLALLNQLITWDFGICKDKTQLWRWLSKILQGLVPYLAMQLPARCLDLEAADLCLETCRLLILYLEQLDSKKLGQQNVGAGLVPVVRASVQTYKNNHCGNHLPLLMSLKCLSWTCHLLQDTSIKIEQSTSQMMNDFLSSLDLQASDLTKPQKGDQTWGRVAESYAVMQWLCVPYALLVQSQLSTMVLVNPCDAIKSFISEIDTVTERNLLPYFDALQTLIPAALTTIKNAETCVCECLDVTWKVVKNLSHSPAFWGVYKNFVKVAFQNPTLSLPSSSAIQEKLISLLSKIATLSAAKPTLLHYASEACIQSWVGSGPRGCEREGLSCDIGTVGGLRPGLRHRKIDTASMKVHTNFILQCLTFHHICKKDDLALHNALKLIEHETGNNAGRNELSQKVTLMTVTMLLDLDKNMAEDCEFAFLIVQHLLELDASMTERKSRYHHNSIHHHMKNKIYQAVLLLLCFVPESRVEMMLLTLLNNLKNDAQPSVRYLIEWAVVMLLFSFPGHDELLLSRLSKCDSEDESSGTQTASAKFSAICSYLTAALLLGIGRGNVKVQTEYFFKLVNICMPWCMSQHFTIRLYALAILLKIKLVLEIEGKHDLLQEKHPTLSSCLLFADRSTGNVGRNWERMKDNFFIFDLDPVSDLSIQTVYGCLPRLCCVPNYATHSELQQICAQKGDVLKSGVRIFNLGDKLSCRLATKWIPQESKQAETAFAQNDRYRRNYGSTDVPDVDDNNVQKKIMPWVDAMEDAGRESESAISKKGLVLVASLIEKASNLGGLTRTCEIFGAEALVVQSLSCTADKLYQSLSITAHKWLPMQEVKPWQLGEYLKLMRGKGYTLIGTEQTAQSVCLSKYRFPEKCVVVLGNEKEGVPIPILKVLDVCVQIPQKGIVRSLNVHVSGAITVWEYARQHLD